MAPEYIKIVRRLKFSSRKWCKTNSRSLLSQSNRGTFFRIDNDSDTFNKNDRESSKIYLSLLYNSLESFSSIWKRTRSIRNVLGVTATSIWEPEPRSGYGWQFAESILPNDKARFSIMHTNNMVYHTPWLRAAFFNLKTSTLFYCLKTGNA